MTLPSATEPDQFPEKGGRSLKRVLAWLMLLMLVSACSSSPVPGRINARERTSSLIPVLENRIARQLFNQAFAELANLNAQRQRLDSITDPSGQWAHGSLAYQQARLALQNKWWSRIHTDVDPLFLDDSNRTSYKLFQYNTEMRNLQFPFRYHLSYVNPIDGLHLTSILYLINRQPARSVSDLESYVTRINQSAILIEELTADIHSSRQRGIVPPKSLIVSVIGQIQSICRGSPLELNTRPNLLMEDFRDKLNHLGLVESEQRRLLDLAAGALSDRLGPAYRRLQDYLIDLAAEAPDSATVWQLPDSESFYLQQLRYFTGADQSPEQLHTLALEEMARLQAQIGTLIEQREQIRPGEPNFFPDSMEGRQAYLSGAVEIIADTQKKTAQLIGRQPVVDLEIKAIEPFREATTAATSYYPPASASNGIGIWYVNLADLQSLGKDQMQARIYHDISPGLHLLYSANLEADHLPGFRRFGYFPAYYLGWAAYMEKTARTAGLYSDHRSVIGQISLERSRACAVAIDTGIHWKHWTEAETLNFLAGASCGNPGQNLRLLQRVLANPGLSAAPLAGQEQFQHLQDKARQILSDDFDIRTYHNSLLSNGPLPRDLLEEAVNAWIKNTLSSIQQAN